VDKDVVPHKKLLGTYELQKFDAKYISERMFSILYEIDLRDLLTSTMLRRSVVMSAKHSGVQALIGQHVKRDVPYIHCLNHKLHFVVQPIRLKMLKPRAPDFGGTQNFRSNDDFQHLVPFSPATISSNDDFQHLLPSSSIYFPFSPALLPFSPDLSIVVFYG